MQEIKAIDKQNKGSEVSFWDEQSRKQKYLKFEKKVYSAFRVSEYVEMFQKGIAGNAVPQNASILDIGCGAGVSSVTLSKLNYKVTGIDISGGLIEQASELAGEEKADTEFVVGDVSAMDFDNNSFDVCYMVGLLHHFPNYDPVLREIYRVLKPGGILIAAEPNLFSLPYLISFHLVSLKNGTSPNEYPLSPLTVKADLDKRFDNVKISQFRENDVPFLRQLGWFGTSLPGKILNDSILFLKNNLGPELTRGTFFITTCKK